MPPMVEAAGYQIALEAISNAYRHSGGDGANVRIGVDAQGTNLVIDVTDNGGGIAPDAPGGVGIESMKSRADAVGGQVQVAPSVSGGTVVHAELPLDSNGG